MNSIYVWLLRLRFRHPIATPRFILPSTQNPEKFTKNRRRFLLDSQTMNFTLFTDRERLTSRTRSSYQKNTNTLVQLIRCVFLFSIRALWWIETFINILISQIYRRHHIWLYMQLIFSWSINPFDSPLQFCSIIIVVSAPRLQESGWERKTRKIIRWSGRKARASVSWMNFGF